MRAPGGDPRSRAYCTRVLSTAIAFAFPVVRAAAGALETSSAMSYSAGGCFLPWDPQRPCRAHLCAQCHKPNATKRCTRCGLAHYCGKECQQAHWGTHKDPCKAGMAAYLDAIADQVRKQAELLRRADVAEEVIAELEASLAMARAIGDAEGERHLCSTLAYRFNSLAEAGGERATEHAAQSEQFTARAAAIADVIGQQDYKGVAHAAVGGGGARISKLPAPVRPSAGAAGTAPASAPDLAAMFGVPTDGDPLGLLSDFGAVPSSGPLPTGLVGNLAPATQPTSSLVALNGLEAPPSPPDDRPA